MLKNKDDRFTPGKRNKNTIYLLRKSSISEKNQSLSRPNELKVYLIPQLPNECKHSSLHKMRPHLVFSIFCITFFSRFNLLPFSVFTHSLAKMFQCFEIENREPEECLEILSLTLQYPETLLPEMEQWGFLSTHLFVSAFCFTDILYREGKMGEV